MADLRVALQGLSDQELLETLTSQIPAGERRRRLFGKHRAGARRIWLWGTLALVSAALALTVAPSLRQRVLNWFQLQPIPTEKYLAVLPFTNVGGDPVNQTFCDGLQETIANKLSQLEQFQGSLRVVPASDVRKEEITSVREARLSFGANLALTGSV